MGLAQQMRQKQVLAPQIRQSLEVLQLQVQDLCALANQELQRNPALEEVSVEKTSVDEEREKFEKEDYAGDDGKMNGSEELEENDGEAHSSGEEYVYGEELMRVAVAEESGVGPESAAESHDTYEAVPREEAVEHDVAHDEAAGSEETAPESGFEVLAKLDDYNYLYQEGGNNEYNPDLEERRQFLFDSIEVHETLQEHLLKQLDLSGLDGVDALVAEQIIGSISDDGYLRTPLADIAQVVPGASIEICGRVLSVVQDFDPVGVGARDLRECLLLQVRNSPLEGTLAEKIAHDHLDLVALNRIGDVAKETGVSRREVEAAIRDLARLEPRPGSKFDRTAPTYIVPEVEVRKVDGRYKAFVEEATIPHLRISPRYARMLKSEDASDETREYLQEKIRSGMNLIKSIEQRQETILNVSQKIVDAQQEFFDKGVVALKPLVMAEIAEQVGVHETTVSRTVSNKYMRSPQGIHELKYFFTNGIPTDNGVDVSSKHVKALIKNMVDNEDPEKPLADQDIERRLADLGINIARRTIAKYRGAMKIAASHIRRVQ